MEAVHAFGLTGLRIGYRQQEELSPFVTWSLQAGGRTPGNGEIPAKALTRGRLDRLVAELTRSWQVLDLSPVILDLRARREALWLDISTEHPLLPAVDWEAALAHLGVPVLRMPGVLGAPTATPRSPRIALWVSMPVAKAMFDVAGLVTGALHAIAEASTSRRQPEVHVFADAEFARLLRYELDDGLDATVHVPEGAGPRPHAEVSATTVEQQPWFDWIGDALDGRTVDVLHLIGHGYLSSSCQGAFACAEAPDHNFDRERARFVWPHQLVSFLTSIGAWGTVFSAAPENYSTAGMRLLAMQTATLRAAATAFHNVGESDSAGGGLLDIYRLLLDHPTPPPKDTRGLSLVMHPGRFGVETERANYLPAPSELGELVDSGVDVPGWLVGAQRQIAQWETQLSFSSGVAQVDSTRAGLELVKSRLDEVMRSVRDEGGLS